MEKKHLSYNVIKFCDIETDNGSKTIQSAHATKRANAVTGISENLVWRIHNEGFDNNSFVSSKKKKKKKTVTNANLDSFDLDVIKRTV